MFETSAPEAAEKDPVLVPLDVRTVILFGRLAGYLQAGGCTEEPPSHVKFELASEIGLASVLPRHSPGKPITGTGGSPIFDWAMGSAPYRSEVRLALERAPGFLELKDPRDFVMKLLCPLVLWIQDLPASESHHHSYVYGLLDHILEVALGSMMESLPRFDKLYGGRDLPAERLRGQALRLTFLLGLVHDIGKVFSVEVKDPVSGDIWDPLREPLAYFKARHDLLILEPTAYRFLPGRGTNGHETKGRDLLPLVLHPRIWKQTGSELSQAYAAYLGRYEAHAHSGRFPVDFIADCVRRADKSSAARSHKGSKPGERLGELLANEALGY